METAGIIIAAALTLMVLSRSLGDNVLARTAQHIFIGVALGYAVVASYYAVIFPRVILPIRDGESRFPVAVIGAVLAVLLLVRLVPRVPRAIRTLSNLPLAVAVGTAAGLVLTGSITGSLLSQARATIETGPQIAAGTAAIIGGNVQVETFARSLGSLVVLAGTLAVVLQFYFTSSRTRGIGAYLSRAGDYLARPLMLIGFGALFASLAASAVAQLAERIAFIYSLFER